MIGDLPLAMLVSPDGRWVIVTNNGYAKPSLTVGDLKSLSVRDKTSVSDAWLGLAWHPDGKRSVLVDHWNSVPVISFGITGVSWIWMFHFGPPVGLSTKY